MPSLTDWIAAVSTALTVVTTGGFGYLAHLREKRGRLPVIEWNFDYRAPYLVATATVRNRIESTITITSAGVRQPKGFKITSNKHMKTRRDGSAELIPPTSNTTEILRDIWPLGSEKYSITSTGDFAHIFLYLQPPPSWTAGRVVIDIVASSKASAFRDRRITKKAYLTAPAPTKSDDRSDG